MSFDPEVPELVHICSYKSRVISPQSLTGQRVLPSWPGCQWLYDIMQEMVLLCLLLHEVRMWFYSSACYPKHKVWKWVPKPVFLFFSYVNRKAEVCGGPLTIQVCGSISQVECCWEAFIDVVCVVPAWGSKVIRLATFIEDYIHFSSVLCKILFPSGLVIFF